MALVAYQHLLRSARIAFKGDARLLTAARQEARKAFEMNRTLPSAGQETAAAIAHAEDVARILRHNIVQGQRQGESEESYKLRVHEDIERGDNETIKLGDMNKAAASQPCSAQ